VIRAVAEEDFVRRPSLSFAVIVCCTLAAACSNNDGTTVGTGGNGGVAGNNAGTGGAAGQVGTGGSSGTGGAAGGAGTGGTGGTAGAGGMAGSKGTGGSAGSKGAGGSAGSPGTGGGTGGTSPSCSSTNPCPGGKVCVSYNCGPLANVTSCTAPAPKCIDNPCDAGVCTTCSQTVCSPFGGNCYQADPSNIECIMPG
jgi:hypothetical protein